MSKRSPSLKSAPLPMKDGVSPSYIWAEPKIEMTCLAFLTQQFPEIQATTWQARLAQREICDQHGQILSATTLIRRGTCIFYYRDAGDETKIPFDAQIVYEDEEILVADKPHFLPVSPGGAYVKETLLARLKKLTGNPDLVPLHRLDRETAGLVLFCKNPKSRAAYQNLFRDQHIHKIYHAIAPWNSGLKFPITLKNRMTEQAQFFVMEIVEGVPNTETHIDILDHNDNWGLYQLSPSTGKKHQLRVHMASLGIALMNDRFYPIIHTQSLQDFSAPLQLLAKTLNFMDPISGEAREFHSLQNLELPII